MFFGIFATVKFIILQRLMQIPVNYVGDCKAGCLAELRIQGLVSATVLFTVMFQGLCQQVEQHCNDTEQ